MKNKIYILFPGALGHDLVYRRKFNASCWCTWHLECKRKDKKEKEQSCVPVTKKVLMTCGAPVNKSASKYYKIIRVPVRSYVCP